MIQACVAIAEAHANGIVHRDPRPANLFLARTAGGGTEVKVLDFGISKILSVSEGEADLTNSSTVLGSLHYMSPDQINESKSLDHRGDIWSLGVILHQLVSRRHAFGGDTKSEVAAKILTGQVRPLRQLDPTVPVAFDRLVLGCLDKDPA